jgi:uncharacterized iron-regulated protein
LRLQWSIRNTFAILMIAIAILSRSVALLLAVACTSCSTTPAHGDWEYRLRGNAVVMLGEVHDNPRQHRLRLEVLRRAFASGWRPAIAMEQFDREHQGDIDRARREKPTDAQHVIDLAAPSVSGSTAGWNWELYRPFVALALEYDVPLIAANLSRADANKVVQRGYSAVFDPASLAALRLNQPIASDWQTAQEREIDTGHCHALPASLLPSMAKAQFARDAVMAAVLREHSTGGVVLLAGDGHVRRDIGVPRWLRGNQQAAVFAVGYLEEGETSSARSFDAVVYTERATRSAPCANLEKKKSAP